MKFAITLIVIVAIAVTITTVDAKKVKDHKKGGSNDGEDSQGDDEQVVRIVREAPDQAKERKEKGQSHAPAQAQEHMRKGGSAGLRFVREAPDHAQEKMEKGKANKKN